MGRCCRGRVDTMKRPAAIGFGSERFDGAGRMASLLIAFLAALAACGAQAHEGAPTSFASIRIADTRVLYSLTTSSEPVTQPGSAGEGPAPAGNTPSDPARMAAIIARHVRIEADGRRCVPGAADYVPPSPPRLNTTYNIAFLCDAPIRKLRVTDDSFDVIGRGAHTLLLVSVQGREEALAPSILLANEKRSAEFDTGLSRPSSGASEPDQSASDTVLLGTPRGAIGFLQLGIQHILEGWDHLLFLLVLVLPGASLGNLVRIVTAFTIAHSLTLAAAVLDWISVPAAPVETLIALSIAWVAAENLVRARPMSHRWAVAFAFGLIHGLGFSNVLREIGLPRHAMLSSLLWFNLGIELGQLLVVLLLVQVLVWLGRLRVGKSMPRALSVMVFFASVVLLVQRL